MPPGPFGGSEGYAFSPDGRDIGFTAKDEGRKDAWTTDINVYAVSVAGGDAKPKTSFNLGADQNPSGRPTAGRCTTRHSAAPASRRTSGA